MVLSNSKSTAHPKIANTDHDILDVIRRRWSPRAFDQTRDVAPDDLRRLFEAARWAPSSMNEQPWRFVVANRKRSPEVFATLVESLHVSGNELSLDTPVARGPRQFGQFSADAMSARPVMADAIVNARMMRTMGKLY